MLVQKPSLKLKGVSWVKNYVEMAHTECHRVFKQMSVSLLVVFCLCPQGRIIIDWNMEAILPITELPSSLWEGGLLYEGLMRCQALSEERV